MLHGTRLMLVFTPANTDDERFEDYPPDLPGASEHDFWGSRQIVESVIDTVFCTIKGYRLLPCSPSIRCNPLPRSLCHIHTSSRHFSGIPRQILFTNLPPLGIVG